MKSIKSELIEAALISTCSTPAVDSNGVTRSNYLNGHQFLSSPRILNIASQQLLSHIERTPATYIAGLALGACGLVASISTLSVDRKSPLPYFYIRRDSKRYGFSGTLTYEIPKGAKVFLVDDILSTGASAIKAIEALTLHGLVPVGFGAVVHRGESGINQLLAHGISPITLLSMEEIHSGVSQKLIMG
ncbi:orotate phosphoribosyltransferase [Pseudomonas sp. HK3]|jgi:orotate phosphoribosyltransferase